MKIENQRAKPLLTELEQLLDMRSNDLTRTAVEQDLLDGGTEEVIYVFTPEDALNPGWGEDGAPNDKNIRHLFNSKK